MKSVHDYCRAISEWQTPATLYPVVSQSGRFRIKRISYTKGYYPCYGLGGAALVKITKSIPVTLLQEKRAGKWSTWMVDDPPHWWAMQYYASKASGRVLTAGLGLGLFHHAASANRAVKEIVAVEKNQDVLSLVGPHLPLKTHVVVDDFRNFILHDSSTWNFVLLDIWVNSGDLGEKLKLLSEEVFPLKQEVKRRFPETVIAIHGFLSASDVRWPISKELWQMMKQNALP